MKNKLTIIALSLALFSIAACRNKCCDAGPQGNFLTLQKSGVEWLSTRQEINNYNDSLFIFGTAGEEHLVMRIKFTGAGKYILTGSQASYYQTIGGDVMLVQYYADPASESVLNVSRYDEKTKTMYGDFSLNAQRYYRYDPVAAQFPQKLSLTKGVFKIQLAK